MMLVVLPILLSHFFFFLLRWLRLYRRVSRFITIYCAIVTCVLCIYDKSRCLMMRDRWEFRARSTKEETSNVVAYMPSPPQDANKLDTRRSVKVNYDGGDASATCFPRALSKIERLGEREGGPPI